MRQRDYTPQFRDPMHHAWTISVTRECRIANGKYFILLRRAHVHKVYKRTFIEEKWIFFPFLITSVFEFILLFSPSCFTALAFKRSLLRKSKTIVYLETLMSNFFGSFFASIFFYKKFLEKSIIIKIYFTLKNK